MKIIFIKSKKKGKKPEITLHVAYENINIKQSLNPLKLSRQQYKNVQD